MKITTDNKWRVIPPKDPKTKKQYLYILNQRFDLDSFKALTDSSDDTQARQAGFAFKSRHYDGVYVNFRSSGSEIEYKHGYVIEKVNK